MTVTRAADLLTDPTYLSFCGHWQEQYRCPLEFSDYLRDWGLDHCADVAVWAATYRDRPTYVYGKESGPYPYGDLRGTYYRWYQQYNEKDSTESDDLWVEDKQPTESLPLFELHDTFPQAIAALLDHFKVPAPDDTEVLG